jgi:hypothetical protein
MRCQRQFLPREPRCCAHGSRSSLARCKATARPVPAFVSDRTCQGCGRAADGAGSYCGGCGRSMPQTPARTTTASGSHRQAGARSSADPAAPPKPALPMASPRQAVVPAGADEDSAPAALVSALTALVIIVFTGAAVAIIIAFSRGGGVAPAPTRTTPATITVITYER